MSVKFFCDENITKAIVNKIKSYNFEVTSVREQGMQGIVNGELVHYLRVNKFTLITFDNDFLDANFELDQGIVIIKINPNRDEFVLPVLGDFLLKIQNQEISLIDHKTIISKDSIIQS